ncbi:hypothetical protein X777_16079 [Ooceraea biroi]|uniref:Uncharacterized protein n=1 Tax=Ooceraea biroi TaxID=2015173 RepID=A0A026WV33_OOCBI|nr:hypothetical protein X777_16079 [Ooceraea biroi]
MSTCTLLAKEYTKRKEGDLLLYETTQYHKHLPILTPPAMVSKTFPAFKSL